MSKNCCSPKDNDTNTNVTVNVTIDVPKIVKTLCITGVIIVGIVFGTKNLHKMLDGGFFDIEE